MFPRCIQVAPERSQGRYLSKNAKGAIMWYSNDFKHVGWKTKGIYYPQVLEQLGRQVLHHIQLKNSCEKFHFFVRIEIAIKMDDRILNFRHFDFICQNFIKALNMTSIALELNHQNKAYKI
jgi:hypothetical protein